MKKLFSIALLFTFLFSCTSENNPTSVDDNDSNDDSANEILPFSLHENGVTILCSNAEVGQTGVINGTEYTKRNWGQIKNLVKNDPSIVETTCTSDVMDMSGLFTFLNQYSSWSDGSYTLGSIEHWDVSSVTNMNRMFHRASNFNQNLNNWDVSNVTSMISMFDEASIFNGPIGNWDVSNVTRMDKMFYQSLEFNQDIESWEVSDVTSFSSMFERAMKFNSDLSQWDVSSAINMSRMFNEAVKFNSKISDWDVSKVTRMDQMFSGDTYPDDNSTIFNQNIGSWDVSSVTNMYGMFLHSREFNQDISDWCVNNITSEPNRFADNSALTENNKPKWGTCPGG